MIVNLFKMKYKRIILVFGILIVFLVLPSLVLADINYAYYDNGGVASVGGTDTNDENPSTYYGTSSSCSMGCTASTGFTADITFENTAATITHLEYISSASSNGNDENYASCNYYVYQGAWNSVGGGLGSGSRPGPWNNVEAVRAVCSARGSCPFQQGNCYANARLYELKAFGPEPYEDVGLRVYNGIDIISIAVYPLGTLSSDLRIRASDGNTYSVVLVPVGDGMAFKVGIQTDSGVMALRKFM